MLTALEAMPGAALLMLMAVCVVGGVLAGRGWDRLADAFYDTCDVARDGMTSLGKVIVRLLVLVGVIGGLLTAAAAAFLTTH